MGRGVVVRCTRLPHSSQSGFFFLSLFFFSFLVRTFAAFRGTSLRLWFQENCGLSGHFASLAVSRDSASQRRFAAYRGTSLRSCFLGFRTPLFLFSPFPPFFFFFFFFLLFYFFFLSFFFFFSFSFLFLFQKKVPATNWDFDFFSKKCLLPMQILIFFFPKYPRF